MHWSSAGSGILPAMASKPPLMIPVDSSAVESVGYHEATRELYVRYHEGHLYAYSPVPTETFEALLAAPSKGTYVNREIKPNYGCRRA